MKGISDPISAGIISIAILLLAIFSIYTVFSSIISIYMQSIKGIRDSSRVIEMKIVNTTIYSNGTAYIYLLNSGSIPITDITKIEISMTINSGSTYLLRYSPNPVRGSWTPLYILVNNIVYPVNRFSLKPGEILVIEALAPSYIDPGSYIEIVVFLTGGKTHYVYVVG